MERQPLKNLKLLAALLSEYGVSYRLLNARPENIISESGIIAQAGCKAAITIATNMAGRGTDISLGGNGELLVNTVLKDFFQELREKEYQTVLRNSEINPILTPFLEYFTNRPQKWIENDENYNALLSIINKEDIFLDSSLVEFRTLYDLVLRKQNKFSSNEKTDIMQLGGLHVIGTERHESRRIDNQLRGRGGAPRGPRIFTFFPKFR